MWVSMLGSLKIQFSFMFQIYSRSLIVMIKLYPGWASFSESALMASIFPGNVVPRVIGEQCSRKRHTRGRDRYFLSFDVFTITFLFTQHFNSKKRISRLQWLARNKPLGKVQEVNAQRRRLLRDTHINTEWAASRSLHGTVLARWHFVRYENTKRRLNYSSKRFRSKDWSERLCKGSVRTWTFAFKALRC
jgi:hypothetical protein